MKDFRLFDGQEIEDLGVYIKDYYVLNPDMEIYVGTDSAQHGKVTKYATAISFLHPNKGVHVIYRKNIIKRERDLFTRLWNEVEYTREVAEYVHETMNGIMKPKYIDSKIPILHLDFNKSSKYKSFMVHDLSMGYLKGLGFEVCSKSDSWCASFCADMLVKN
jgi:predicted RNase H-related nuclease YkuK (DUF458 family)